MKTILRNCRDGATGKRVDIAWEEGTITEIGTLTATQKDAVIEANGTTVLPGLIDPHVHFRQPGGEAKEDWTTGSRAAARGGFTTVLDMPNTTPPLTNPETLAEKRRLAANSIVNYGFHFALTRDNINVLEEMPDVHTIKLFLGRSTGNLFVDPALLADAFIHLPHVLFLIHAESEACLERRAAMAIPMTDPAIHSVLRDRTCALEAMQQVLELLRVHARPVYFCHISTREEVELIRAAKADGLPVFAEVTPHHLFLDERTYAQLGIRAKVNPPLRTLEDSIALLEALNDGTIDTIGTDHAPHLVSEKQLPYTEAPAGLPGLETALPLMLNAVSQGLITLQRVVQAMAERPAEIFGLMRKGIITVGADADFTLVDPGLQKEVVGQELQTKCGWSPWEGSTLAGWPVMTIVNGNVAFDRETFYPHHGKELSYV